MNALWNAPISDRFSSLYARVFSPAAAILESEKTLGTRLLKYLPGGNRPKLDLPNATMKQSCNNGYLLSQRLQAGQKFIHGASTTMITQ